MINIDDIRNQFPAIRNNQEKQIYFDNGTTTLKHQSAIDAVWDYMTKNTSNSFDSDFPSAIYNDNQIKQARKNIAKFMGCNENEVIFSLGTTSSIINISEIIKPTLKAGDEILINNYEHSANHFAWLKIANETKAKLKIIELDIHEKLVDVIKDHISDKTKVISFAATTNSTGQIRDIKKLAKICRNKNIISVVDGAQFAASSEIKCHDWDVDFFVWGPHKTYSTTGVGIIYGKYSTLEQLPPQLFGGGSVNKCDLSGKIALKPIPYCYQYGTQNIPGIIATGQVCKWMMEVGQDNIHNYVYSLRKYAIDQLAKLDNIEIYNSDTKSSTIVFNMKEVPAQDVSDYLGKENIASRAGDLCAKLTDFAPNNVSVRISFAIYNTKKEVDIFIAKLKNKTPQDIIGNIIGS